MITTLSSYNEKQIANFWEEALSEDMCICESREELYDNLSELANSRLGIITFKEFQNVLNAYINSCSDIIDIRDIEDPAMTGANTNTFAAMHYQTIA